MGEPDTRAEPWRPLIRTGLRGYLELDRVDLAWVVALTLLAFVLRFASPILPDFLSHPFGGAPVRALGVGHPYNSDPKACADVPSGMNGPTVSRCGYVFDEVYFPVDAARDLHQPPLSYFDPEPPLAKSLMVPPIAILGFNTWSWRWSTTVAGSLFIGLLYLIARRLRRDRFFAVTAALLLCLDGLPLVESRTGVIDMIAISFVALLYYAFLLHWQARTRTQWRTSLYVLATVAGLALGAKLTALAPIAVGLALVGVRCLQPWLQARLRRIGADDGGQGQLWREAARRRMVLHYAAAAALTGLVFAACFARYLSIEHRDVYRFSSCTLEQGLQAPAPEPMPAATVHVAGLTLPDPVRAVRNIAEKTAADLQYHQTECHSHPYASSWYSWPLMYHPVLFYYDAGPSTDPQPVSVVTDMGNPAVWWPGIIALLFCVWRGTRGPAAWRLTLAATGVVSLALMIVLFHAAQRPDTETVRVAPGILFYAAFAGMVVFAAAMALSAVVSRRFVPAFIVLGYLTAWLMWVPGNERRILFFYHALGMSIFLALALAYALAALRAASVVSGRRRLSLAPVAHGLLATVVAGFIFFYPVWTAVPLTNADHMMRTWVDSW